MATAAATTLSINGLIGSGLAALAKETLFREPFHFTMRKRTKCCGIQDAVRTAIIEASWRSPGAMARIDGPIASKLQEAVNRCKAGGLERGMKYEDSTHCRSLRTIARQSVEAGGFTDKTACPADRIAETARARAWMPLVSKTDDQGLAIW
jgi:hypothetical protein